MPWASTSIRVQLSSAGAREILARPLIISRRPAHPVDEMNSGAGRTLQRDGSAIAPLPSAETGVYAFMAPMTMAGRWVLSIKATVRGEFEMVTGTVTFQAAQ